MLWLGLLVAFCSAELLPFVYRGESHYDMGFQMGTQFADRIQARMSISKQMQKSLLPFYSSEEGQNVYKTFLDSHWQMFPNYMDEMKGVSDGSRVPFHVLFLMTLREEFSYWINGSDIYFRDHCSDYMLNNNEYTAVGHNEDGAIEDVDHMILASVTVGAGADRTTFTTVVYLGELATGAFGFNAQGVALSLNYVSPAKEYVVMGGKSRNFVARDVLQAQNIVDAIARFTQDGQCAGHNSQLMDVRGQRIFNVEAAAHGQHNVLEITPDVSPYFHANMYLRLSPINITQPVDPSTVGRTNRVHQLPPPTSPTDILNILGDQADRQYPLFHDVLSHVRGDISEGWTLASAIFDLRNSSLTIYHRNPKLQAVQYSLPML